MLILYFVLLLERNEVAIEIVVAGRHVLQRALQCITEMWR